MFTYLKKKIIYLANRITEFAQKNIVQIIIVGGTFAFLQTIKSLPYINIIPNYQFLVLGFTLLLAVLFFKILISNKNIILVILSLFGLAAIMTIFEMTVVAEWIGFIVYILLIVTLRQVIRDRKKLKEETTK